MKLRHKDTGDIIDLPDFLPDYEDAKEIARVFHDAAALSNLDELPPAILRLKTFSGDIIQVEKITNTSSHFPYETLIRIHLHLPPHAQVNQQNKSTIWTVLVNGKEWSVGDSIFEHRIQKLEWTKECGWWAITEGIYAIQLDKIPAETNKTNTPENKNPDNKKSIPDPAPNSPQFETSDENHSPVQIGFTSWIRRIMAD